MIKLVIKGAYYYDRKNDVILVPHFTGEYFIVDCTEYSTIENLKGRYNDDFINNVLKTNPIKFEGKKYYEAEYSPFNINDWELLSDLSELNHIENDFDF